MNRTVTEDEIARALPCYANHCDGFHVLRRGKHGPFYGCTNYPRCTATTSYDVGHSRITHDVFGEPRDPDEPYYGM